MYDIGVGDSGSKPVAVVVLCNGERGVLGAPAGMEGFGNGR